MSTSQKNMKYWGSTFLPSWAIEVQSNRTELIGCFRCASEWEDPPQGPPTDFRKTIVQGVYSFSWIVSKRLDKQIKNDRPPYNRIIENPDCAYSYQTRAEPDCAFSGDKGEPKCTRALKPEDNNLDYHKRNSQSMRNLVRASLAKLKGVK